ncbi:MAG: hypothetical protein JWM05_3618 [Acidimicrobiales bacterium]|nr:hypothetical protein [Acidimicrobiales bacterium]
MPKVRTAPSARPAAPVAASRAPSRIALHALVVLVPMAVLSNLYEPFQAGKLVVLVVGAAVLVGLAVWEVTTAGAVQVPAGRLVVGVGAFVAVLALATLLGDHPLEALFGDYGRSTGLLAYAAAAIVLLTVVRTYTAERLPDLALAVVVASVPVAVFGLLQVLGFQPLGLTSEVSDIVGTLGQPNFVAGYVGMALPFALWAASRWRRAPGLGIGAGALALALVLVGLWTESFQAIPSLAAGAGVLGLVLVAERFSGRAAAIALAGTLAVTLVVGVAAHGYVERQVREGLNERVLLWQAGRDMVIDHPVLGRGPVGYATQFSQHRPAAHAFQYGVYALADSPHDVPLSIFVIGGIPLGLLYLAFVGATGALLVRGLRRLEGEQRILLGAFGGAWAAYQVQSLISIDSPTLVVVHVVAAGAIWVLAGAAPVRTVVAPVRRHRGTSLVRLATFPRAAAVALVVAALWWTTLPVRADVAYRHSLERAAGGDAAGALDAARTSVSLASWNGRYWANEAAILAAGGAQEDALVAGWKAAVRVPSALSYSLSAAQTAHQLGRLELADRYFAYAVAHGPSSPEAHAAWGGALLADGRYRRAIAQFEQAHELKPLDVAILSDLGTSYEGAGQREAATRTWRRILVLDPANQAAIAGLAQEG